MRSLFRRKSTVTRLFKQSKKRKRGRKSEKKARTERKKFRSCSTRVHFHLTIRAFQICVYARWVMGIELHIIRFNMPLIHLSKWELVNQLWTLKEIRFFLYRSSCCFFVFHSCDAELSCASWFSCFFFFVPVSVCIGIEFSFHLIGQTRWNSCIYR